MEKIVVHCRTKEQWDKVRGKHLGDWWDEGRCVCIQDNCYTHSHISFFQKEGYKIISASEFLGKEEPMFKVGDEAEVIIAHNNYSVGAIKTIRSISRLDEGVVYVADNNGHIMNINKIKLVKPSKATLKEEEMNTLLEKVLSESKVREGKLVEKHIAKIIGNMEDTLVNLHTLEAIGAKKLIAMAVNLEDEANKKSE